MDTLKPLTPAEVIQPGWFKWKTGMHHSIDMLYHQSNEMQEALTAEWLIEHDFMPDPSEFLVDGRYMGQTLAGWRSITYHWTIEDKSI